MTTTTQAPALSAESIVALHAEAAAIPVLLTGTLDAKIAEVKALLADLAVRQGIVDTLEKARAEADSTLTDAKASSEQMFAAAEAKLFDATSQQAAAQQALDAANARQTEIDAKERALLSATAKFEENKQSFLTGIAQGRAELEAATKDLAAREATLSEGQEKLKADRAEINRRLEALRVVEA